MGRAFGGASVGCMSELDGVQAPFVGHSFEEVGASFGCGDVGTDKLSLYRLGYEYFRGAGKIADAFGDADCKTDHVVGSDLDLADVHASAHVHAHAFGGGH